MISFPSYLSVLYNSTTCSTIFICIQDYRINFQNYLQTFQVFFTYFLPAFAHTYFNKQNFSKMYMIVWLLLISFLKILLPSIWVTLSSIELDTWQPQDKRGGADFGSYSLRPWLAGCKAEMAWEKGLAEERCLCQGSQEMEKARARQEDISFQLMLPVTRLFYSDSTYLSAHLARKHTNGGFYCAVQYPVIHHLLTFSI